MKPCLQNYLLMYTKAGSVTSRNWFLYLYYFKLYTLLALEGKKLIRNQIFMKICFLLLFFFTTPTKCLVRIIFISLSFGPKGMLTL